MKTPFSTFLRLRIVESSLIPLILPHPVFQQIPSTLPLNSMQNSTSPHHTQHKTQKQITDTTHLPSVNNLHTCPLLLSATQQPGWFFITQVTPVTALLEAHQPHCKTQSPYKVCKARLHLPTVSLHLSPALCSGHIPASLFSSPPTKCAPTSGPLDWTYPLSVWLPLTCFPDQPP